MWWGYYFAGAVATITAIIVTGFAILWPILVLVGLYYLIKILKRIAEGFATTASPLSTPSPNLNQAFQFRLGKREMVDAAVGQMAK